MNKFSIIDIGVFIIYCFLVVCVGFYAAQRKSNKQRTTSDYFLAGNTLPWWAVGASIIAANISAEQFIGMSGSGYVIGLAMASYEWIGAATLIIVGRFFLPVFIRNRVFTMPQFLEKRFDNRVKTSLAIYWMLLYVFINLTSILYLGALFLRTVTGVPLLWGILILGAFTALYSLYGGLMSVAWTDVIHVTFLVGGGLVATIMGLKLIAGGDGIFQGLASLYEQIPDKFEMILDRSHPSYDKLPGLSVILGGMWVGNISYWGFSQYVTQKAFAAKNLDQAQKGTIFAGYIKLLMPFIVVLPGMITCYLQADIGKPDEAYPWLMASVIPMGLKGAAIAALFAAIVSSLSSMANSTSTIFTMDIYRHLIKRNATEKDMVKMGRIAASTALAIAMCVAPLLGNVDQAFQYIQEYSAWISPAIVIIFVSGFFWKKATSNAVLWVAIASIVLTLGMTIIWPDMPFMRREEWVFGFLVVILVGISLFENKVESRKEIILEKKMFHTSAAFNIGAIGILTILGVLYTIFW
jgi:SSS family solute:Na+ symporter